MTTDTQPLTAWEIELMDAALVDVDLTKERPCDAPDCERTAVWILYPPCGHNIVGCDPCRKERDLFFAVNPLLHPSCLLCAALVPYPLDWRPL